MFPLEEIIIRNSAISGHRLTSELSVPRDLRKYIQQEQVFIEYDAEISATRSILNVPLTATVLPLAWITGSDVYVDELDKAFAKSMNQLQHEFKKYYPKFPFKTHIIADTLVENKIGAVDPSRRTGLLFSGGVDSTYSLLTNLTLKPCLIMMWGIDDFPYPQRAVHWEKAIETYTQFATQQGLTLHLIKTNISQILHDKRIEHDFHERMFNRRLRFSFQHSLLLLPTTAPLSVGRFDRVLIAATQDQTVDDSRPIPSVTRPGTDEKIVWADVEVTHDGYIPRAVKIGGVIKDYLQGNDLVLRVCHKTSESAAQDRGKLNDSSCRKCLRTIAALVLAGIDPNDCGFEVDHSTFKRMRAYIEDRAQVRDKGSWWGHIQSLIPDTIENDLYGSKAFFEWFKEFNFDLAPYRQARDRYQQHLAFYYRLPYAFANLLASFYSLLGIKVQ